MWAAIPGSQLKSEFEYAESGTEIMSKPAALKKGNGSGPSGTTSARIIPFAKQPVVMDKALGLEPTVAYKPRRKVILTQLVSSAVKGATLNDAWSIGREDQSVLNVVPEKEEDSGSGSDSDDDGQKDPKTIRAAMLALDEIRVRLEHNVLMRKSYWKLFFYSLTLITILGFM